MAVGQPMRCAEIHAELEQTFGIAINKKSVKSALSHLASDLSSPVTRTGRGLYAFAPKPEAV